MTSISDPMSEPARVGSGAGVFACASPGVPPDVPAVPRDGLVASRDGLARQPEASDALRIALVTEVFLPKFDGVVTTVVRSIDQLRARGHEVVVLAPGNPPATYNGCQVEPIRSLPFRPWYPELSVGIPCPTVTRTLDAFRPDVVHVVSPVCLAAFAALRARARGLPIVASYHTDIPQYVDALGLGALRPGASVWLRHIHNLADVNLCPSAPLAQEALSRGIGRVRLWPGGVDTDLFRPDRRSAAMRSRLTDGHPESPLVLAVGRLSREKSWEDLAPVIDRLPGARLAFVGAGPHEDELRRLFAGRPVVFTGRLGGAELAEAYASADVLAFPSTTDTLGLVALEAAASGIPVVGARAGGIPDALVDGATGLLVAPHDAEEMAAALGSLLADDARRAGMGRAGRLDAVRRSWSAATDVLEDAYREAIRRHAPAARGAGSVGGSNGVGGVGGVAVAS